MLANPGLTLGSTGLTLGAATTAVSGLTLSGATVSGTTTLPGGGASTSGGDIGIGTANPQSSFQVTAANPSIIGYSRFTTSDYVDGSVGSGLVFNSGANTGNTWSSINAFSAGNSAGATLVLNTNGTNVGVDTADPHQRLTIQANTSASGSESALHGLGITTGAGGQTMFMGYDGTLDTGYINVSKLGSIEPLSLQTRGGNVGIGTTAPGALLSIANGANDATNYGKAIQITNVDGNRQQIAFIRNGHDVLAAGYNGATDVWGFGNGNATDASFSPTNLSIDLGNSRVGIGTASPAYSLDVEGGQVNGSGGFVAGGAAGVSCSGAPTAAFAVTDGIVTHC